MSGMSNGVVEMHGMSNDVREECCITVMTGRCVNKIQAWSNETCQLLGKLIHFKPRATV